VDTQTPKESAEWRFYATQYSSSKSLRSTLGRDNQIRTNSRLTVQTSKISRVTNKWRSCAQRSRVVAAWHSTKQASRRRSGQERRQLPCGTLKLSCNLPIANTWPATRVCWARSASFFRTRSQRPTFMQTGNTSTSTRGVEFRPKRSLKSSRALRQPQGATNARGLRR